MILTPLQKLPNNVGDLGKIIVATGFEWLPKLQKIAQSGHILRWPSQQKTFLQDLLHLKFDVKQVCLLPSESLHCRSKISYLHFPVMCAHCT